MTATPFDDLDTYIALPRVSGLAVSADGSRVVTTLTELNDKRTEYFTAIWELDPAGQRPARRLTRGAKGESAPTFTADGDVLFVAVRPTQDDDKPPAALWRLPAAGGEAVEMLTLPGGVAAVRAARDAAVTVVAAPMLPSALDIDDDKRLRTLRKDNKVSAVLHTGYPVHHFDHDLGPDHPHLLDVEGPRDLTPNPSDALREADFDVSADGRFVVTSWHQPAPGASIRRALVRIDRATGERMMIADDPEADLEFPAISPDGMSVAYTREAHSTPDRAPRTTLCCMRFGEQPVEVADDWDRWPTSLTWAVDGSVLIVTADEAGRGPVFAIDPKTSTVSRITDDDYTYTDVHTAPDGVVYALRSSYAAPPHPVRIDPDGTATVLPCVEMPTLPGNLTELTATADDGVPIRSWLALPDGSKDAPAPLLLWVHGGPLGSWNAWHWRWNPWLLTAQGYAVLMPDPALSTGYGQDFIQRGWGAWGAAPYTDLLAAADAACAHPRVDGTRTAAMGGSFGGYMANWIAGHTDRFDAIVTHASLWALDQFGPTTDGAYWWAREMTPEMTARNSPHHSVREIRTPMLVIHGDKDYRVPIWEALGCGTSCSQSLDCLPLMTAQPRTNFFTSRRRITGCSARSTPRSGIRWSPRSSVITCSVKTSSCRRRSGSVSAMSTRELDIVLYGATGFVGKLTAQYLAQAGGPARIALAGRSTDRLLAVRESLGESAQSWPLIAADASSPSSLSAMAAQARVVVTTVGPYTRYGLPLVAACAAAGTDYADLTGEAMFVRESIDLYHKQAADTGARIVHACGFDSIPSDLSVYALHRRAVADGAGELVDTDLVVRAFAGGLSGGTIGSMMEVMDTASRDQEARRTLDDPYTLTSDRGAEPDLGPQSDLPWRRGRDIAPELGKVWTAGFVMAPYNTRIVRRSNALQEWAYGRRFRYAEHLSLGSSVAAPVASAMATGASTAVFGLASRYFKVLPRKLVERIAPKPGTGPSEKAREQGHYTTETYTTTTAGARYVATMSQRGDPGYKATSVLLGESGLALALDRDRLSDLFGVLTPAAAMGDALLARFPAAGVSLETSRLN